MIDLYYWPPLTVIKSRQTAMHWARVRISMDSPKMVRNQSDWMVERVEFELSVDLGRRIVETLPPLAELGSTFCRETTPCR
jgi:hypothetical protein